MVLYPQVGPVWRDRVGGTLYPCQESVIAYYNGPLEQLEQLLPQEEGERLRAALEAVECWLVGDESISRHDLLQLVRTALIPTTYHTMKPV